MAKEKNKTELPKVMEGELQARLIKLREDAGLDVSQMAEALCLSEDVINNLENEAFDLLAEPPYVRGYLRNYAKLGDDEDASELITRYEALRGADADELDFQIKPTNTIVSSSKKRLSPVWGQVILLGVLLGGIGLLSTIPAVNSWVTEKWQGFSSQLTPSNADNNPSLLGNLPVPSPLPEDELIPAQQNNTGTNSNPSSENEDGTNKQTDKTQKASSKETLPNSSDVNTANKTETQQDDSKTSSDIKNTSESTSNSTTDANQKEIDTQQTTSTEQVIPGSADGTINIKLVFEKDVWLRIKDKDNKTVFEGLNKASTEKVIDLEKPLTFRVGNAQGLSLFIDNKAVDISSYTNGSIANFTLE